MAVVGVGGGGRVRAARIVFPLGRIAIFPDWEIKPPRLNLLCPGRAEIPSLLWR